MISDEQLDEYRIAGTLIRVIRDQNEENDIKGFIIAWDDEIVAIRRRNRKIMRLSRSYTYQPASEPRTVNID